MIFVLKMMDFTGAGGYNRESLYAEKALLADSLHDVRE